VVCVCEVGGVGGIFIEKNELWPLQRIRGHLSVAA